MPLLCPTVLRLRVGHEDFLQRFIAVVFHKGIDPGRRIGDGVRFKIFGSLVDLVLDVLVCVIHFDPPSVVSLPMESLRIF